MASDTFFVRQRSASGGLWRQSRGISYAEHPFGVTSAAASVADDDLEDSQSMGASGSKFRGSRSHLLAGQRSADGKSTSWRSSDGAWHHNSGSAPYGDEVATQQNKLPKVLCARIGMSSSASSFMPRPGCKTSVGPAMGVGRKPDAELQYRVQSLQEAFAFGGSSGSSTGQRLSTGHYRPLRGHIPMATVRVEELAKPRRREPAWSDVGVRSLESLSPASATTLGDGSEEGSKMLSLSRKPRRQPRIPVLTDQWQAKLEANGKAEGYCSNVRPKVPPKKPASIISKPSRKAKTSVEVDIGEAEIQQMEICSRFDSAPQFSKSGCTLIARTVRSVEVMDVEEEKEETGIGKVPLEPAGAGINVLDTSVGIAQQQPQQEQPDQAQPKPDEKEKAGLQHTVRFDLPTEASVSEDAVGINDGKIPPASAGEEASGNRDIDGDVKPSLVEGTSEQISIQAGGNSGIDSDVKPSAVEGTSEQTSTQEQSPQIVQAVTGGTDGSFEEDKNLQPQPLQPTQPVTEADQRLDEKAAEVEATETKDECGFEEGGKKATQDGSPTSQPQDPNRSTTTKSYGDEFEDEFEQSSPPTTAGQESSPPTTAGGQASPSLRRGGAKLGTMESECEFEVSSPAGGQASSLQDGTPKHTPAPPSPQQQAAAGKQVSQSYDGFEEDEAEKKPAGINVAESKTTDDYDNEFEEDGNKVKAAKDKSQAQPLDATGKSYGDEFEDDFEESSPKAATGQLNATGKTEASEFEDDFEESSPASPASAQTRQAALGVTGKSDVYGFEEEDFEPSSRPDTGQKNGDEDAKDEDEDFEEETSMIMGRIIAKDEDDEY